MNGAKPLLSGIKTKKENRNMKAYKGTNKDLTCNNYQYELGKTHIHEGDVEPCSHGFHACTNPIDVLHYYPPCDGARYFEVECSGEVKGHDEDSKIACSEIKFEAEINIISLVKLGVSAIFERVKSIKATSGDQSTAATSGYRSTAATSGKFNIAVANGYKSRAKGSLNNYIVLTEYSDDLKNIEAKMVKVDGEKIKADTLYMLVGGEFVEAGEEQC